MTGYEELLTDADKENIIVTDQFDLSGTRLKGLYCDGTIALNKDIYIESEKACVLAEELGHHYTTVGDIMDQAEEKLNWALLLTTAQLVLDMFFFAAAESGKSLLGGIVGLLAFVVSVFALIFAQQKIVDLTRNMNPEKKGSVYDVNFKKKWFESCDEAEQKQIGQAAYKAFNVVNTACPILWAALLMLSFAFNFSPLMPTFIVCFIWLLLQVSYCLETIRLGKRKA